MACHMFLNSFEELMHHEVRPQLMHHEVRPHHEVWLLIIFARKAEVTLAVFFHNGTLKTLSK